MFFIEKDGEMVFWGTQAECFAFADENEISRADVEFEAIETDLPLRDGLIRA